MVIDFATMKQEKFEHFKGGKGALAAKIFSDGKNKLLWATLEPGSTVGVHTHKMNSEIIYIVDGVATIKYDAGPDEVLHPGEVHYCPQDHTHSVCNEGTKTLTFFAVVPEHHQ